MARFGKIGIMTYLTFGRKITLLWDMNIGSERGRQERQGEIQILHIKLGNIVPTIIFGGSFGGSFKRRENPFSVEFMLKLTFT